MGFVNSPLYNTREKLIARIRRGATQCWPWDGWCHPHSGYGSVSFQAKTWMAHRLFYTFLKGEIPPGLKVLHHCDNPKCCNPDHHFLGTQQDNLQDMCRKGRHWRANATHCRRGHEYTPENTRKVPSKTARICKICEKARYRIKMGWPVHLAYSERKVPMGYSIDRTTGEIISSKVIRNTAATAKRPLVGRINFPDRYPRNKALRAKRINL